MNAPTCVWNPKGDGESLLPQQMRRWRRPAAMSSDRAERPISQGRDAADMMDSFRMNLRQAKHTLTIRDVEARKLRLAVTHLEGVLSQRERELRDTVLCLHGKSLPRPHQEWLQAGTSNSRLRLQVHRLQRALAAKQDHIEHLNRQASLGFLREAREQADEYRIEAARLSHALAAATGGVGCRGQLATRTPVDRPLYSAPQGAGDTLTSVGVREEEYRNKGVQQGQAAIVDEALYAQVQPFRSHTRVSSAPRSGGRGDTQKQQRIFDESIDRRKPLSAWDAEAAIQPYLGRHGAVLRHEMRVEPRFSPSSNMAGVVGDLGTGLLFVPPPTRDDDEAPGLVLSGKRPISPQRSTGRTSARIGHGRSRGWTGSPDRCRVFSEKKRLSCMAASARLRTAVRQSALEHREVLALSEESRRLQTVRAERARRTRMVQQRIAKYREERIRELERRLERRCGTRSADEAPVADAAASSEPQQRHESDDVEKHGHKGESGSKDTNASVDIGITHSDKLQQLSRERREIDAAIAAEMGGDHEPSAQREPPDSARRHRKELQEQDFDGSRHRWQRRSSRDDSVPAEEEPTRRDARENAYDLRTRPLGKPPLAPSHAGRRRRPQSAVRRRSSVSEVAESISESSDEDVDGEHRVDEVHTEATRDGRWHDQHLSDEESVWEENIPSGGWNDDGHRGAPGGSAPPALVEAGKVRVRRPLNDDDNRRRNRHWVRNDEVAGENNGRRDEGADARSALVHGRDYLRSGRVHLATRKHRSIAEKKARRSSLGVDELNLRPKDANVGGLSDRNKGSRAHEREAGGRPDNIQPESEGGSVEGAPKSFPTRRRRRRRRDEGDRARIDNGRFSDPIPSFSHSGEDAIGVTVTSGIREERHVADGDVEDDGDSCSSRWSLSEENEPQESKFSDDASPTRQAGHGVGGESRGSSTARTTSQNRERDRNGRRRKAPVERGPKEGAIVSGSTDAAGIMPEYLDDFSGESGRHDQDNDVAYGVSSPSDDELEAFAAAEEGDDTQIEDVHRQGRHRPHFDTNTPSNQKLIEEPPFEPAPTGATQDSSSTVGDYGRSSTPQPAEDSSNNNQVLLQPVSPPVLRHSAQAVEFGVAPIDDLFPVRKEKLGRPQPLVEEATTTKVDDSFQLKYLSASNTTRQTSTLRSHGTPNLGQTEEEDRSEADDLVAPLKIDSVDLFASLSASTAGASLSSKSIARIEESRVNTVAAAATARQPAESTSTFALSTDDGDDAGATHGDNDDNMDARPSSTTLNGKRAGNRTGLGKDEPTAEDNSTLRRAVVPSTSVPPKASSNGGNDTSTTLPEISHPLASSPPAGRQQTPASRVQPGDAPARNRALRSTQQPCSAVTSGDQAASSTFGNQAAPLLDGEEEELPQVEDQLGLQDDDRSQNEEESQSLELSKDGARRDEGSDGIVGGEVQSQPALSQNGEDHISGDREGDAAVAALERQRSRGEDSSQSGSVLDIGGGGFDVDDDDGYF